MKEIKDLTGQQFGRLTVIEDTRRRYNGKVVWRCRCSCGKVTEVAGSYLTSGNTRSCGCLRKEIIKIPPLHIKHKKVRTRHYRVWLGMKERCYNPHSKAYKNYGGRGIEVCFLWKDDFQAFHDWAMSHGYDPDAPRGQCTIDRIDVNGNYEPSNCRFVDMAAQANNRRNTKTKKE